MNEPPGARARVALTGLTVAEYFRDEEGQDGELTDYDRNSKINFTNSYFPQCFSSLTTSSDSPKLVLKCLPF
jgi:hypothetical protein